MLFDRIRPLLRFVEIRRRAKKAYRIRTMLPASTSGVLALENSSSIRSNESLLKAFEVLWVENDPPETFSTN
jgi:hypothetical protein